MEKVRSLLVILVLALFISVIFTSIISPFLSDTSLTETHPITIGDRLMKAGLTNPSLPIPLSDIYIPEIIPQSVFGLKIFTGDSWHASELIENNPFDYSKPTIIYAHGMGDRYFCSFSARVGFVGI